MRPPAPWSPRPTAGLPEQVGGERNWDYRFTWVRDGSFSIHALLGLGFTEEAEAFGAGCRPGRRAGGRGVGPLKIMYRVDGSSDLDEETLDHWEGYAGSKPVRIGNGAADQLQLDIYGELLDSIYLADRHGIRVGHPGWVKLAQLADWVCAHWDQPDEGVWETRGGRQNFTYGRLMCWVALDRMVRLAREHGRPADLGRWIEQRDRIYTQIIERGWNPKRRAFTQHDQTEVLDASLLMMPLVGFVAPQIRCGCRPWTPWTASWSPTAWSTAMTRRLPRRAPSATRDLLDLHLLVCRRPGPLGPAGAGPAGLGEDVHLRQPPGAVRRGDRPDR
jgi:GH15 family glucan-1,4-alpha-glucosidase